MKPVTARFMHEQLKKHWTVTEFATHFEITEEDFLKLLEKQFPGSSYKDFKSALRSNEKYRKRIKEHGPVECQECIDSDTSEDFAEVVNATIGIVDMSAIESFSEEVLEECIEEPIESVPTLEDLLADLEQICAELNNEEITHKDIVASRIELRNQMQSHKDALVKIKASISEHERSIDSLLSELANTEYQMDETNAKIQLLREAKVDLEVRIERAKKVSILVYSSGDIEFDTQSPVEIPEWSSLFDEIVKEEELDSLTVKQIKSLAKVIVLVRCLIEHGTSYEASFDERVAEEYFEKVIS